MARRRNADRGEHVTPTAESRGKSLLALLPLVAALLTAGSVCLHAIGIIAHRVFLNEMGVPPDLFPKDVTWILTNGFYALLDRWYLLFKIYADRPWRFFLYCILFSAALLAYWQLLRWNPKKAEWAENLPTWIKTILRFFSLCLVVGGSVPAAVSLVLLLMVVVGAPGEYAGKAQAEKVRQRYAKGCSVEAPCTDVIKAESLVISGPVLDASQSHLAVYNPATGQSYVVETNGVELRRIAPSSKPDN